MRVDEEAQTDADPSSANPRNQDEYSAELETFFVKIMAKSEVNICVWNLYW